MHIMGVSSVRAQKGINNRRKVKANLEEERLRKGEVLFSWHMQSLNRTRKSTQRASKKEADRVSSSQLSF
jgi:hypothetical protein